MKPLRRHKYSDEYIIATLKRISKINGKKVGVLEEVKDDKES